MLTGTPYLDILSHGPKSVAFGRYKHMVEDAGINLGKLSIQKFSGHQTKLAEIFAWMDREEERVKTPIGGIVIDYPDKIQGRDTNTSEYLQMRDVYEGIRLRCEDKRIFGWGASQAKRIGVGEMPTVNDCADSQHKARVTDGMIGITRLPDNGNQVLAKALAVRTGAGEGAEAGPLPNGFDYGCFVRNCAVGVDVEEALKSGNDPY